MAMNTRILLVAALIASASTFTLSAQRDARTEKGVTTIVNGDKEKTTDVEETFKSNAPQTPKVNGLPRFAIVGKEGMFYLGIGAQFLGEGVYTWGADMPSALDFTPASLTPSTPGNGGSTQFAWQTSSIYMNFVAMPGSANQLGIFFKGHFTGTDNAFSCSHFYARYRGLTAGKTNSLFTDGAAEPMTIDNEGPNGYPDLTLFTAYWQQKFTDKFSGAIGIDAPSVSMTAGSTTGQVKQRIPSVPLYLQYAWNGGDSHVRLSGLVRPMQYRNLDKASNTTIVGGGVQLSGMANIVGGLGVNFNGAYGRGIGSYLQDDNGLGLDAVETTEAGKMATVKSLGLTGGMSYVFSPKVTTNVAYSHLVNWMPDKAVVSEGQYRYGDYVAANVIYNINKFVSVGVEYDYGLRKDFNGETLHANRVQCQLAVTF